MNPLTNMLLVLELIVPVEGLPEVGNLWADKDIILVEYLVFGE